MRANNHPLFFISLIVLFFIRIPVIAQETLTTDSSDVATASPTSPSSGIKDNMVDSGQINPFDGQLTFHIPLVNVQGRGEANTILGIDIKSQSYSDVRIGEIRYDGSDRRSLLTTYGPGVLVTSAGYRRLECHNAGSTNQPLNTIVFNAPNGSQIYLQDEQLIRYNPVGYDWYGQQLPCYSYRDPSQTAKIYTSTSDKRLTFVSDTRILYVTGLSGEVRPSGFLYFPNGVTYRMDAGVVSYLRDKNGNKISFEYGGYESPYLSSKRITKATDSLGRTVSISYGMPNESPDIISYNGFLGENKTVKIWRKNLSNALLPGYTIKSHWWELFSEQIDPNPSYNPPAVPWNPYVITDIEFSDGRSLKFRYNSYAEISKVTYPSGAVFEYTYAAGFGGPGGIAPAVDRSYYIRVDSAHLTYYPHRGVGRVFYRRVTEVRSYLSDGGSIVGRTTYSRPDIPGEISSEYVQVKHFEGQSTLLDIENHYYYGKYWDNITAISIHDRKWSSGLEYKTECLDENGQLKKMIESQWTHGPINTSPGTGDYWWWNGDLNQILLDRPRLVETKVSNDLGQNFKETFSYDNFLNIVDSNIYNFDGNLIKRTHTDYVTDGNYITANSSRLISLPLEIWTATDLAGNNKESLTKYEYDNYSPDANHAALVPRTDVIGADTAFDTNYYKRGNVTAITMFENALNLNTGITVYSQYDVVGNVIKTKDGRGYVTQKDFTDQFGQSNGQVENEPQPATLNTLKTYAFLTKTTNPLGQSSRNQFDYYTGLVVDTSDINGTVNTSYYNDALNRPTQVITANNDPALRHQETIVYDDFNHQITHTSDLNSFGDSLIKNIIVQDSLGRVIESRKYQSNNNSISTKTKYDYLRRTVQISNPFHSDLNESVLWTTMKYDALDRITEVKTPDNAIKATSYIGNAIIETDQTNKSIRLIYDALGRVVRADEPVEDSNGVAQLGSIESPIQPTYYGYDSHDNIILSQQTDGSGITQTRTFNYDSLSRLKTSTSPEMGTSPTNGTVNYTYDETGNLKTVTDPRQIKNVNYYDPLNRLTKREYKRYDDSQLPLDIATPTVDYSYDGVYFDIDGVQKTTIGAKLGKVTCVRSDTSITNYTAFDSLGRLKASQQITDNRTYDFANYSYNFEDQLISQTYPSGREIKNIFDGQGNLAAVSGRQLNTSNLRTYASDFSYNAARGVERLRLGNGRWETTIFNERSQPIQMGLGTTNNISNPDLWKINLNYGGIDNNGNLKTQTITVPTTPTYSGSITGFTAIQTYSYDSLNRLKSASEMVGNAQTWKQTYSFDRFGNRSFDLSNSTIPALVDGSPKVINPTANPLTNRFKQDQDNDGQADYLYDENGNLTKDAVGKVFLYNAENKQKEVKNGSTSIGKYYYDGSGQRVKKVIGSNVTIYVYDGNGKLAAEYSTFLTIEPQTNYLTSDSLGSPRVVSNQDGTVTSRRDFMPFGEELYGQQRSGQLGYQVDSVRQKFTGYERDEESSLDYAEARYYSSKWGRFTGVDPVLIKNDRLTDPQRLNLYAYVRNNSLRFVDSNGKDLIAADSKSAAQLITDLGKTLTSAEFANLKITPGANIIVLNPQFQSTSTGYKNIIEAVSNSSKKITYYAVAQGSSVTLPDGTVLPWQQIQGGATVPIDTNDLNTAKQINIYVPESGGISSVQTTNGQTVGFTREIETQHEISHSNCGPGQCAVDRENKIRTEQNPPLPQRSGLDHESIPTDKVQGTSTTDQVNVDISNKEMLQPSNTTITTTITPRPLLPLPPPPPPIKRP